MNDEGVRKEARLIKAPLLAFKYRYAQAKMISRRLKGYI